MRTMTMLVLSALAISASACATQAPLPAPSAPEVRSREPYRPGWTAGLALHMDEIRLCLATREPPHAVVHVQDLATGATGVTAVDGFGQAENCAVHDGRIVLREPADLELSELEGLPIFAPGPQQPTVAPGVLVEEVEQDEVVLGWLFWPSAAVEGRITR